MVDVKDYIHNKLLDLFGEHYAPIQMDGRVKERIRGLASVVERRGIRPLDLKAAFEKLKGRVNSSGDVRTLLNFFASDVNNVHMIKAISGMDSEGVSAEERIFGDMNLQRIVRDAPVIASQVLAWRLGLRKPEHIAWARDQTKWHTYANEAKRLLASGKFLDNPDAREGLIASFRYLYRERFREYPENLVASEKMRELGIPVTTWLNERLPVRYTIARGEIERVDELAEAGIHSRFYRTINRLVGNRGFDSSKVVGPLKNLFRLEHSVEVRGKIRDAAEHFNHHTYFTHDRKYELNLADMNGYLLGLIEKLKRHIEKHNIIDSPLADIRDELVALQRVIAPHDASVSLDAGPTLGRLEGKSVRYFIQKSSKDPIHFYTAGNDSGVCDATNEPKADKAPLNARNYAVQYADIYRLFREEGAEKRKRIGQIRYYVGIHNEKPVLLINSIDLESEERSNLRLYRMAIDYSKRFAGVHGFSDLWLGKHGDQHIRPFDHLKMFSDLQPAEEHFEVLHTFPQEHAFSDFFGEYETTKGKAKVYKVDMKEEEVR